MNFKTTTFLFSFLILFIFFSITDSTFAQSLTSTSTSSRFIVGLSISQDQIVQNLLDTKIINDKDTFLKVYLPKSATTTNILPGAYKIPNNSNLLDVVRILKAKPYMVWITFTPGLRKEEIANILTTNLNWNPSQKKKFLGYTTLKYDYIEGVYFPDTYLIPTDENPENVYKRIIAKFNEKFASALLIANKQGFQWTKVLILASILQREAADKNDMPLIAGILLNRLDQKIPLSVDATLQYIRGDKGRGYWAPISIIDKKATSTYNTYTHTGLPPHPISNPGLDAINAVLNPAPTDCIYYLHKDKVTYCAKTYGEHQANIEKYLK